MRCDLVCLIKIEEVDVVVVLVGGSEKEEDGGCGV